MASSNTGLHRLPNVRMLQNFHLVWLDGSIKVNDDDRRKSMRKLRQVVNTVNTFTDVDKCINFITDVNDQNTLIIISQGLSQIIIPIVQNLSQVNSVYIYCDNEAQPVEWAQECFKVKGVFTDITTICEALKEAIQGYEQNSVSISIINLTDTILKENLNTLDWWYTYESFLYSMLNRALRLMEVDRIIKMGFFVRDLQNHIAQLHAEQYAEQNHSDSFTLYRGQGLSQTDFDRLRNTQGGLLAFNNFLSTSKDNNVSLRFARRIVATSDLMGVLFIIKIDFSTPATPFANVKRVSFYQKEEEILFSMHSVFRIGQVQQIEGNGRLFQVNLTLTSDNDPQLHALTKSIQEETSGSTGWLRLGKLIIKLGQYNKAEELYEILLKQTNNESEKGRLYHQLGWINGEQGKYAEAVVIYEKALEILKKNLPANHPDLAISYNNIGLVYHNMGDCSKSFSYYEKALLIEQNTLPGNHPHLAASYDNIGGAYENMGEYSKALSYFEKALEIRQKTLP